MYERISQEDVRVAGEVGGAPGAGAEVHILCLISEYQIIKLWKVLLESESR